MNRIEAAFYLFKNSGNKVKDARTGTVWHGLHMSSVTNMSVLPMYVIEQLPDSEFTIV
jgi:hypothetical protein